MEEIVTKELTLTLDETLAHLAKLQAVACDDAGSLLEAEAQKRISEAKWKNLVFWIEARGINYAHDLPPGYRIVKEGK